MGNNVKFRRELKMLRFSLNTKCVGECHCAALIENIDHTLSYLTVLSIRLSTAFLAKRVTIARK